jgi:hypothetical protein
MSRGPLKFKETDLRRAVRAVSKEGLRVREVTVDREGNIRVVPCPPSEGDVGVASGESVQANPWDEVLSNAPDEKRAP